MKKKKNNNNFFSSFCKIYFQEKLKFLRCIFPRVILSAFCYIGAGVFDISKKNLCTHVFCANENVSKWIDTTMLIIFNNDQLKYLLQFSIDFVLKKFVHALV